MADPNRRVGTESRKSYAAKIANGFVGKYLSGDAVLDVGFQGGDDAAVPITPAAIGVDLDYPGYDGRTLPFPDDSQDAVYSSHCMEHIREWRDTLRDWFRVLKPGGFLIVVVPHQYLYEKQLNPPSRRNPDHKRFYTPAGLLRQIEEALVPNSYRIRHMMDNDAGFDYGSPPALNSSGCYEIELVLEKLSQPPKWSLEDGSSGYYPAHRFDTPLVRTSPFFLDTDFSTTDTFAVFGPYIPLAEGDYSVVFHVEPFGLGEQDLSSQIYFDAFSGGVKAAFSLDGAAGARMLREKQHVSLRFSNNVADSLFEFRVVTSGRPFAGRLRFLGVWLERVWDKG